MPYTHVSRISCALAVCAVACQNPGIDKETATADATSASEDAPTSSTGPDDETHVDARVVIRVLDETDRPVPAARVKVGADDHASDRDGLVRIDTHAGRFVATVDTRFHAPASVAIDLLPGADLSATVRLLPLGTHYPMRSDAGVKLSADGVHLDIPADAIEDPAHSGYPLPAGTELTVTIVPLDPTLQREASPGPLRGAFGGGTVPLDSMFMAEISVWHGDARMQLLKPAHLELELPVDHPSAPAPGTTVPAWWFDHETGIWREEGEGTLETRSIDGQQRLVWSATIPHLTWWNADVPLEERNCIDVTVLDKDSMPVPFVAVTAKGLDYAGHDTAYTDLEGQVCLEMMKGIDHHALLFVGEIGDEYIQPTTVQILQMNMLVDMGCYPDPQNNNVDHCGVIVTGSDTASWCGGDTPCIMTDPFVFKPGIVLCNPQGEVIPCDTPYSGPPGTEGVGECHGKQRACMGQIWEPCGPEVTPGAEECDDTLDNDCDGLVNEEGTGCPCNNQSLAPNDDFPDDIYPNLLDCYSGDPPWTMGLIGCSAGQWTCIGNEWSCEGEDTMCDVVDGFPQGKFAALAKRIAGPQYQAVEDITIDPAPNGQIYTSILTQGVVEYEGVNYAVNNGMTEAFTLQTNENLLMQDPQHLDALGVAHIPVNPLRFVGAAWDPMNPNDPTDDQLIVAALCTGQPVINGVPIVCGDMNNPVDLVVAHLKPSNIFDNAAPPIVVDIDSTWLFRDIAVHQGKTYVLGIISGEPVLGMKLSEVPVVDGPLLDPPFWTVESATGSIDLLSARLATSIDKIALAATTKGEIDLCGGMSGGTQGTDVVVAVRDMNNTCTQTRFQGNGAETLGGISFLAGDLMVALSSTSEALSWKGNVHGLDLDPDTEHLAVARLGQLEWLASFGVDGPSAYVRDLQIAVNDTADTIYVAGGLKGTMSCKYLADVSATGSNGGLFLATLKPENGLCNVARTLTGETDGIFTLSALAIHPDQDHPVLGGTYRAGTFSIVDPPLPNPEMLNAGTDGFLVKITAFSL